MSGHDLNMNRRGFLTGVMAPGVGALGAQKSGARARNAGDQPNFLILISDQHNPHVLGCYGDKIVRTPNMDALAEKGVVFEHAYCASPLCVPSRMSFMTGMQPCETKVWGNGDILPSDVSTFAHCLGGLGYETALIGHMHFLGLDQWHGFDKLLVGLPGPQYPNGAPPLPPSLMVGARCDSREAVTLAGPGRMAYGVFTEAVGKTTADYLRQKGKEKGRPFCAVAGMLLPHPPFICDKAEWDYYLDRVTLPQVPAGYFDKLHPAIKLWRKHRGIEDLTPDEIRRARAAYYSLVTQTDRQVGLALDALRETGLDKNTVVIYTSDHGEMAGENGMWWKFNFYEGSVSVPLIVSCPEKFQSGRRVKALASLTDVGPTLVDLASTEAMPGATGKSLAPLLRGEKTDRADEAFSEYSLTPHGESPMRMVRSGRWKLVHHEGQRPQLFDLESDPHELNDLAEDPAHAEVRKRLGERVLTGWSAEEIGKEMAKRAPHRRVIGRWCQVVNPPSPQRWIPPKDANIFPL